MKPDLKAIRAYAPTSATTVHVLLDYAEALEAMFEAKSADLADAMGHAAHLEANLRSLVAVIDRDGGHAQTGDLAADSQRALLKVAGAYARIGELDAQLAEMTSHRDALRDQCRVLKEAYETAGAEARAKALEAAVAFALSQVVPTHQGGGVAIESRNDTARHIAAGIQSLAANPVCATCDGREGGDLCICPDEVSKPRAIGVRHLRADGQECAYLAGPTCSKCGWMPGCAVPSAPKCKTCDGFGVIDTEDERGRRDELCPSCAGAKP